ncbi:MAG: T9SS type A sorting domain-containing protein [Saprospiraceae bacterium]|nr:T9SS type A sorting domain-containing protein [Saprospiraceae bacterium]
MHSFKQFLFFTLLILFSGFEVSAQTVWKETKISSFQTRSDARMENLPESYSAYTLSTEVLRQQLKNAEMVNQRSVNTNGTYVELPVPNGQPAMYHVVEQPVMEEGLMEKFPELKAYKGFLANRPETQIWFTFSPYGFSAAISDNGSVHYIDQLYQNDLETYIMYDVKADKSNPYEGIPLCGVDITNQEKMVPFMPFSRNNTEVETRTYRLAMACTGEWGRVRVTVAKCLSDMNIMVTRLTQIYESELAIRFVLINDNDKLIFLDPDTDPYNGSDMGRVILPTNTGVLNDRVGVNSYDVGHVLSRCFDVGGVAALGSACQSNKGNGVTCFNDMNFEYAVASIMAHEVGHQFDATHTMNSCAGSQENVTPGTGYEPGSGSTIMSYGGLCGVDNVFSGSDPYFHVASLEQMFGKSLSGGNAYNCAQKTPSGNRNPSVAMPSGGFTIPISTPFALTASGSDEDGDALTYRWEQYNLGPQSTLGSPTGSAPLFRSLAGVTTPTRFFPAISKIFKNQLNSKDEVLPTGTRNLTFKCVVKDNKPEGVGVTWDDVSFNVTADAGPFVITFPRLDARFNIGDEINVTWDVANTDVAPVNCKLVNIYLSINEALHDNDPNLILLASNVPNTGSRKVVIPANITNRANFVIKAADNIFLTTSVLPSMIQNPMGPALYVGVDIDYQTLCLPATADYVFNTLGINGLTGNIQFEVVSGLPAGAVVSFSNQNVTPGENTTMTINLDNVQGKGIADIGVKIVAPGIDSLIRYVRVNYTATNLDNVSALLPVNGTTGSTVLPSFSWTQNTDAVTYQLQLATSPSFESNTLVFDRIQTGISFNSSVILDKSRIYYWRVRGINQCKDGLWSDINAFSTEVLSCNVYTSGDLSINISASGRPTVETSLNIPSEGNVSDINIKKVKIDHQRNGDLIASVVSPSNKEIILWSKKCGTQKNISVGLDDESPLFFGCPLNNDRILKPENKLSGFNGESTKGAWKLIIKDDEAGEGGRLLGFDIEICSNVVLSAPYVVNNIVLQIPPGDKPAIRSPYLLVQDDDNTSDQLVYTVVTLPEFGILSLNGNPLSVGATFTQSDINNASLRYTHDGSSNPGDRFTFTVFDGQGGWVPITSFTFEVDESFPSDTKDVSKLYDVLIYPNPVTDQNVQVSVLHEKTLFKSYTVFDAKGQKVASGAMISNNASIPVIGWNSGLYSIILYSNEGSISKTFIKQ